MLGALNKQRIVIKVGTSTLTHVTGALNIRRVEAFVKVLSDIKNSGKEIIIVTSGAVAIGAGKLGLKARPKDIPSKQACAAVGQCELMHIYDKLFSEYNHTVAQVLLTRDIVENEVSKENVVNTMDRLLTMGAIPIVNENDTVSYEEINMINVFGDNDKLSAIVAGLAGASKLIILSDINGLYDKNPRKNKDAKLIPEVRCIDDTIRAIAEGAGTERGTGGMVTKIHAAEIAAEYGIEMTIINGNNPSLIYDVVEGIPVGTRFIPGGGKRE